MTIKIGELFEMLPEEEICDYYYNECSADKDIDISVLKKNVERKVLHKKNIYRKSKVLKVACILLLILLIAFIQIPSVKAQIKATVNDILNQINFINEENESYIGKPIESEEWIIGEEGRYYDQEGNEVTTLDDEYVLPDNKYIKSIDSEWMEPSIIKAITLSNKEIPSIMIPNSGISIFRQNDDGWHIKKGDTITIEIEKYPHETIDKQILMIGYIKDGIL